MTHQVVASWFATFLSSLRVQRSGACHIAVTGLSLRPVRLACHGLRRDTTRLL